MIRLSDQAPGDEPGGGARSHIQSRCSPDLMIIVDASGAIAYESPSVAQVLGRSAADLVGGAWLDLVHPDDVAGVARLLPRIVGSPGVSPPIAFRVRRADGSWRCLEALFHNLLNHPRLRLLIISARDITERHAWQEWQERLLLSAVVEGQEEERMRIRLDLHDGVCQTLATAQRYLETLEGEIELPDGVHHHLRRAIELIHHAGHEAREVISTSRPATLDTLGLVATLRHEVDELSAATGLAVTFTADVLRIPKDVETVLYRVLHEAINNVVKHAQASRLVVRLRQTPHCIAVRVRDDGCGFDPTITMSGGYVVGQGSGLAGMRKRIGTLHGCCDVVSFPGRGTLVRISAPVEATAPSAGIAPRSTAARYMLPE